MRQVSLLAGRLHTSRLGFGTSSLHHLRSSRDRAALLDHCFSRGVRHFDTAPLYGHELAEKDLGRFIQGRRSDVTVATKFGIQPNRWFARSSALLYAGLAARTAMARTGLFSVRPWNKDYDPRQTVHSLERSLQNLGTDYVDLYLAHDPSIDSRGVSDELVRELQRIRDSGKARFIGLAGSASDCLAIARQYPDIVDILQVAAENELKVGDQIREAGFDPGITFGYFRSALSDSASANRSELIRKRIEFATLDNPRGIILFSARTVTRIDQLLAIFGPADSNTAG
jgi:aryl-alcohol dehydrogenase-like predicted oxidoreductase